MVVYKIKEGLFGIVDGQQRLTTITIILGLIRNAFKGLDHNDLAKGIHNFIEREDKENKAHFVLKTEASYPFFQKNVQNFDREEKPIKGAHGSSSREEELIKKAYDSLKEIIDRKLKSINKKTNSEKIKEKISTLKKIRDKLLALIVIHIQLENEDDAYIIFERLNTRGKNLRLSDLVKNHLIRLLPKENEAYDTAKDMWKETVKTIETSSTNSNMDDFLHHFWMSRYKFTTQIKVFKLLKESIKKKDAKSFSKTIQEEATTYKKILEASEKDWKKDWKKEEKGLVASLFSLSTIFRVKQQIPMVLSTIREYKNKNLTLKNVKTSISAIEKFHFIFTAVTSQRSSGGISLMYASHAIKLFEATEKKEKIKILSELNKKLKDKLPARDEFITNFSELRYTRKDDKNKKLVKYILTKYDMHHRKGKGVSIDYEKMTIEHIEPESSKKTGYADSIGKIGNLLLCEKDFNGKLANKSFTEKLELYKKSDIYIDETIKNAREWSVSLTDKRTTEIAEDLFDNVFNFKGQK